MSQSDFGTIDPNTKTGTALASDLNSWRTAVHSGHSGVARPSYAVAGMRWIDTSSTPLLILKQFDGTDDIEVDRIQITDNIHYLVIPSLSGLPSNTVKYQFHVDETNDPDIEFLIRDHDDAAWRKIGEMSDTGWTPFSGGQPVGAGDQIGDLKWITHTNIPTNWQQPVGQNVLRASFVDLNALYSGDGYPFGNGNGTTTFDLPDLRSQSIIGQGQGSGFTLRAIGDNGGVETHPLTLAEGPAHTHTIPTGDALGGLVRNTTIGTGALGSSPPTGSSGSGTAHETMHPFLTLVPIIKVL